MFKQNMPTALHIIFLTITGIVKKIKKKTTKLFDNIEMFSLYYIL